MEIPFVNIADVSCWIVYLMPYKPKDRINYELVDKFQRSCIEQKIFGMGWSEECFDFGTPMTEENATKYVYAYNQNNQESVSEDVVKDYKSVKEGDYVIARLKNGHYYVGRVNARGITYLYKENDPVYSRFSWGRLSENYTE